MGCDIIMSVPWHCGDKECPVGWHKADYWLDEDAETGYTVDHYSDGDHELIEESELPSAAEEASAWREYARDVAYTGKDPLGNYLVKHSRKVRHNPVRIKSELVRAAKRHLKCLNEQLRKLMIEEQKKEEVT